MTIRCNASSFLVPDNTPPGPVPPFRLPSALYITLTAINPADLPTSLESLMEFSFVADMSAVNTHPPCPCINRPTPGCRGQGAAFIHIRMADGSIAGPFPWYDYDGKTELIEEQINAGYAYKVIFNPALVENGGSSDEFPVGWLNAFPQGGFVLLSGHPYFAPTEHKGTGSMTYYAQENLVAIYNVPDGSRHSFRINGQEFLAIAVDMPGYPSGVSVPSGMRFEGDSFVPHNLGPNAVPFLGVDPVTGDTIINAAPGKKIVFRVGGADRIVMDSGGNFYPAQDEANFCGAPGKRWFSVQTKNGNY